MKKLLKNFATFKEWILSYFYEVNEDYKKGIDQILKQIASVLSDLKEKNHAKLDLEYKVAKKQLSLIHNSIVLLNKEIQTENIGTLHPNKLYHINSTLMRAEENGENSIDNWMMLEDPSFNDFLGEIKEKILQFQEKNKGKTFDFAEENLFLLKKSNKIKEFFAERS